MICPRCKHDIPVSSDYCPECGARQTQKQKQQRFRAAPYVVAIVALLITISILSSEIATKLEENENNTTAQTVTHSVTATSDPSQRAVMENTTGQEENEKEFTAQPEQREPSPFDDDIIDVDIDDCHIEYLYHEIVQNMAGDWCIAVYYQFTNNSYANQAFYLTVSDKAFQNGVELEDSLFHVNDDSKTREMEIQPGVSVTVCSGFVLRDTSDIELQISPWISLSDTPSDAMILSVDSEG